MNDRCCESFWTRCRGKPDYQPRSVYLARPSGPTDQKFPPNIIRNQKYSVVTFIPLVCGLCGVLFTSVVKFVDRTRRCLFKTGTDHCGGNVESSS